MKTTKTTKNNPKSDSSPRLGTKNPIATEIVSALISRFPNAPALTLAKRAYKENPSVWKSVESVRSTIRSHLGINGKWMRKTVKAREFFRERRKAGNPFTLLPESLEGRDGWKNYVVDTPGSWGVISDIHIPFHNLEALRVALAEGKKRNWRGILINGDLFDFPQFSRFDKDPRNKDFPGDLYKGRQFLHCLRTEFPKARIIFKFGNHDLHYSRYLWLKAPELLDVESTWLENLIECEKFGVEVVKNNEPVLLGKLIAVHGHEFAGGSMSPVSPAKTIHDRLKESGICGHWHKATNFSDPAPVSGQVTTCWSSGCLCGLHPEWARLNKWGHGLICADIGKDGSYSVDNLRIIDGEAWH